MDDTKFSFFLIRWKAYYVVIKLENNVVEWSSNDRYFDMMLLLHDSIRWMTEVEWKQRMASSLKFPCVPINKWNLCWSSWYIRISSTKFKKREMPIRTNWHRSPAAFVLLTHFMNGAHTHTESYHSLNKNFSSIAMLHSYCKLTLWTKTLRWKKFLRKVPFL